MKCATCRKPLGTSDRRVKYCSEFCKANKPAPKRKLRAVGADERPVDPEAMVPDPDQDPHTEPRTLTVDDAAREGTDLEFLMAIRDRLADAVADETCPPRELAALTRRLEENRKQINAEKARLREEGEDDEHADDERWDADAV
ncbi:hypothetical protein [Microbacterium halotolerans]|uniref:hypothetical protein n=1 Tax=Microbacterium halotolerans TaxID=246613 RepID=UPI000E6AA29D|nr:hypothetical protein [Microbacterium halotolerans]